MNALLCSAIIAFGVPAVVNAASIAVSNTSQLVLAVAQANSAGGNLAIQLADGTYTLTDTLYVNTPNVTIVSASGNRKSVVIQGDAMSANASVKTLIRVAASHFTLQSVTLQRAGWHLVQIVGESNADAPVIRNVIFRDAFEQMLKVSDASNPISSDFSSNDGLVEDSLFEYSAGIGPQYYIGGIDAHAAKNWIVRDNTFLSIASPNTSVAEFAIHFWDASSGNTVERNLIINCDRGIGFGLEGKPNIAGIIRNNMIYHANNAAAYADTGIALTESPGTQVYNNTIYFENGFPWVIEYRYANTTGAAISNNLSNRPIQARDGATAVVTKNVVNAAASWFVGAASGDLHLSRAVAGVVDSGQAIAGLTDDFDRQSRPQGPGIDIGADEYSSVSPATKPNPPSNLQAN